jgi:hypothetical protein
MLGRHPDRIAIAQEFGATDVVRERGDEAVECVRELTDGLGANSVLECVVLEQSTVAALNWCVPAVSSAVSAFPRRARFPRRFRRLFVRSVNGRVASWFRGPQIRHQARIRARGIDKDVTLLETDDANDVSRRRVRGEVRPPLHDDRALDRRAAGALRR